MEFRKSVLAFTDSLARALEASRCLRCCSIRSSDKALLPSAWVLRLLITPLKKSWVNWELSSCAETERSAVDWYDSLSASANFSAASLTCCCCFWSTISLPPFQVAIRTHSLPDFRPAKHQRSAKVRSGPESPPQKHRPDSYALPGGLPHSLQALLVVAEGRVSEVHIGVDGLLDESLVGVALVLGALEELASNAAVALSLVAELLDGAVHHALREPDVPLLEAHRVIHNRLVGIPCTLSEPLYGPAGLLLGGHLYLLSRVIHELLATLFLVLQRPARVQPEEIVHGVLVLLQRLGPEIEVCPARV